jgi:uncharacterized protein GlcG (DUF336 family)
MSELTITRSVSRELARAGIDMALDRANQLGCRVCIAVVDAAGHLVSYDRMDGTPFQSARHAQDKADSAAGNGLGTHEMWAYVKDNAQLRQGVLKVEGLSIIGGGVPIRYGKDLIGVSGDCGMSEDQSIAEAAVAAILDRLTGRPPASEKH